MAESKWSKLFTWVDLRDTLLNDRINWPENLIWIDAYWTGLSLGLLDANAEKSLEYINNLFEERYLAESKQIIFEDKTCIDVVIEENVDVPSMRKERPTVKKAHRVFNAKYISNEIPQLAENSPEIICYHSFKGGVGRTLHAVAMAKEYSDKGHSVLLIDSDLEAPGITYLAFSTITPDISYTDFLALLHSDDSENCQHSIEFTASLVRSQKRENIFILPAFRNRNHPFDIEITPEDIQVNFDDEYVLTHIISRLGIELGVDVIIIDSRAGLSDISTAFILDPRINRFFVSTISGQSIEGLERMLKYIAPTDSQIDNEYIPSPSVILTQIPEVYNDRLSTYKDKLSEAFFSRLSENYEGDPLKSLPINFIDSHFNQELIVLPVDWDNVLQKIAVSQLQSLFVVDVKSSTIQVDNSNIESERRKLAEKTKKMVVAENGEVDNFLPIQSIKKLASDFSLRLPNVVIIGAKGAGKTLIFLELSKQKTWDSFVRSIEGTENKKLENAYILPITEPSNLQDKANAFITNCLISTYEYLQISQQEFEVKAYIRDNFKNTELHESNWRDIWLNVIAYKAGYSVDNTNAGRDFIASLKLQNKKIIAVFDGIEDLFQSNDDIKKNTKALRGLIQELPEFLDKQLERNLGVIIVVRQDFVDYAIEQNKTQFYEKYKNYRLKWNHREALKLVSFIAGNPNVEIETIENSQQNDLYELFKPIWGLKLGMDNSKQAYSLKWILTALSDWNNQIQARDLVRFLYKSSENSISDSKKEYKDRLIVPSAIKDSFEYCSQEKVKETKDENKTLEELFKRLSIIEKKSPFSKNDIDLTDEDISVLEKNGIVIKDKDDQYYVAQLYIKGLNFTTKGKGRITQLSKLVL